MTKRKTLQHKLNEAAQEVRASVARAAIRPTLLRQPEVRKIYNQFPRTLRNVVGLGAAHYSDEVYLHCYMYDLESFKDKQLLKVIEPFADWDSHVNDYTTSAPNRDFQFTKTFEWQHDTRTAAYKKLVKMGMLPTHYTIRVGIYSYVKSDSPLCRVVVEGVKEEVVRTEIKKIVCA